jgi:hypothetical protein
MCSRAHIYESLLKRLRPELGPVTSIHPVADKGSSRKLGFRCKAFSETQRMKMAGASLPSEVFARVVDQTL